GRAAPEEDKHSVLTQVDGVYGNTKRAENVYVKIFQNSPFLICMDFGLAQEVVIDPVYSWTGPDGTSLEGQTYANLNETGKLMLTGFKEFMSGAYTCTLSHKIIETTTQEEADASETYIFMVYGCFLQAYREADHAYQISVRFTAKECELAANAQFIEELRKILDSIIWDLTCRIAELSYRCHSIRIPNHGLPSELFVTFQVDPFAPGWEELCRQVPYDCEEATNRRVQQARDLMAEFFRKQTYALQHVFQAVPTIHYVDSSFSATPVDSCQPGFGKSSALHEDCAGCCVVCSPGTFSPNNDVSCQPCTRAKITEYGAKSC
ncbi:ZPBP2 protein, partial [Penelope pileata]|nr:ZPBP2 protein [Penelope pileata]